MTKYFCTIILFFCSINSFISAQNYAYIAADLGGGNSKFHLMKYDLTNCTYDTLGVVNSDIHEDIALNPIDGKIYFIGDGYYLSRLDPVTLELERLRYFVNTRHSLDPVQYWQFIGIEFDAQGNLYMANGREIFKFDPNNNFEMSVYHDFGLLFIDVQGMSFFRDKLYIKGRTQQLLEVDTSNWEINTVHEPQLLWLNYENGLSNACTDKLYSNDFFHILETDLSQSPPVTRELCELDFYIYGIVTFTEYQEQTLITETEIQVNGDSENQHFSFCIDDEVHLSGNTPNPSNFEQNEWLTISNGNAVNVSGNDVEINNLSLKQAGTDTILYRFISERDGCMSTDTAILNIVDYPNRQLVGDSFICDNQTTTLFTLDTNSTIQWYYNHASLNQIADSIINISSEGSYWAEIDNGICPSITSDTFHLSVHQLTQAFIQNNKTDICIDEDIQLIGNQPNYTSGEIPVWKRLSDGATAEITNFTITNPLLVIKNTGTETFEYSIELPLENCIKTDTITIQIVDYPTVELSGDSHICENEFANLRFSTDQYNLTYYWLKDGNIVLRDDSMATFSEAGIYHVSVTNHVCPEVFSNSVVIKVDTLPKGEIRLNEEENLTIMEGNSIVIRTTDLLADNVWRISSSNFLFSENTLQGIWNSENNIGENIIYLTSTNGVCEVIDTAILFVKAKIKAPNVFTPNGDGINETFKIRGLETYSKTEVSIHNRWGKNIFFSNNYPSNPWNGKNSPTGVYYFVIKTEQSEFTGVIHLIR